MILGSSINVRTISDVIIKLRPRIDKNKAGMIIKLKVSAITDVTANEIKKEKAEKNQRKTF